MFQIYYTIIVIIIMTTLLILEVYKPSIIMFGALMLFYFAGIININETISGFSNIGVLTIALLFIVSRALESSKGFGLFINSLLKTNSKTHIQIRLMFPVAVLSAFINNIPVVTSLIPVLKRWCKKNNYPASKLLIPLSYAAIVGGMCTLIGTSTNLLIHGLLLKNGFTGLKFFEIGIIGLPVSIIVILYMVFIGNKFLPENLDNIKLFNESAREFVVAVKIQKNYPFLNRSIEEANLRHLRGLFLFQIIRNNIVLAPIKPNEKIQIDDRLFFTGMPETILDLLKTPGIHLIKDAEFDIQNIDSDKLQTYEAVISSSSPLIGNTVKNSLFRSKYNAVILAIHRNGHRLNKKIGEITFQAGDTLFLLGKKDFGREWYNSLDFSLVSESISEYSKPKSKGNLALILLVLMIISVTTGLIESMLIAAIITVGIMLISRIISIYDAKNSIDFNILLVIVSSLGIAQAVTNSGVAELVANFFVNHLNFLGYKGIIIGLFVITCLYTELITNNASAAIMFPIAVAISANSGIDLKPLILTITIAASTSFSTPFGYQTNLMVFSPGGYKFSDYLKTGLPINIIIGITTVILVYYLFF